MSIFLVIASIFDRLSYDESYNQLKQWLDEVSKSLEAPLPDKGTLVEKQEQLTECQVINGCLPCLYSCVWHVRLNTNRYY